ncbi:hypothetical protein ACWGSK_23570 [Nocardiopsis sp. NPDC055551]|uniref:hypothetical protein n=1 Tax=Nocardiopsis sp. NPDC006832 TaxID=3157188 RepID=UPI003400006E
MAGRSLKQTRVLVTDALDGAPWVVVMSTLVTALERIIVMGPESGHPRPVIMGGE